MIVAETSAVACLPRPITPQAEPSGIGAPVHAGIDSISVWLNVNPWGGLYLHNNTPVPTAGYDELLSNGGDRYLPWDRRISLATVLVRGGQIGLARDQMRRCMGDLNEGRLRSLSTASLYDLLVLAHAFGLEITDPRIRDLAVDLLPDNLRGSL